MRYFITPTHNIVNSSKALSSSIAKAVVEKYYKESINTDMEAEDFYYKCVAPQTETPDKPTIALMREPIDRFLSACAMNNTDAQEAIDSLESGLGWQATHPIFEKQNLASVDMVFIQIEDFCKEAALDYPLPKLNEGRNPKPVLTKEQISSLKSYYAEDIKLFESLK